MRSDRIALVAPALFALAACQSGSHMERYQPVTGAARAAVITAVENLRTSLNNGECQAIYDQADPSFRRAELHDWLQQCEQVREKLGTWQSFDTRNAYTYELSGRQQVIADGSAMFAKGTGQALIQWRRSAGRVELEFISLHRGSDSVNLPDFNLRKYSDPPMERPRIPSGS